jgi:hypothetical protein
MGGPGLAFETWEWENANPAGAAYGCPILALLGWGRFRDPARKWVAQVSILRPGNARISTTALKLSRRESAKIAQDEILGQDDLLTHPVSSGRPNPPSLRKISPAHGTIHADPRARCRISARFGLYHPSPSPDAHCFRCIAARNLHKISRLSIQVIGRPPYKPR